MVHIREKKLDLSLIKSVNTNTYCVLSWEHVTSLDHLAIHTPNSLATVSLSVEPRGSDIWDALRWEDTSKKWGLSLTLYGCSLIQLDISTGFHWPYCPGLDIRFLTSWPFLWVPSLKVLIIIKKHTCQGIMEILLMY